MYLCSVLFLYYDVANICAVLFVFYIAGLVKEKFQAVLYCNPAMSPMNLPLFSYTGILEFMCRVRVKLKKKNSTCVNYILIVVYLRFVHLWWIWAYHLRKMSSLQRSRQCPRTRIFGIFVNQGLAVEFANLSEFIHVNAGLFLRSCRCSFNKGQLLCS